MRILYVITTPDHGGAQVNVLDLISGFSERFETFLITGAEGFLTEEARALGCDVRVVSDLVRPVHLLRDWKAYGAIRRLVRSIRPDLVHCHSSKAGLIARLAASSENVPVVFTVHGWAFEPGVSLPRRVTGLLSEHIASRFCENQHIITVAEASRALAAEKHVQPPGRMTTVHNGIPDVAFRAQPGEGNPPVIIMVARFSKQKDHHTLLRALVGLDQPCRVWFVGDGPRLESVSLEVEKLGLADRVTFLGDRHDVPELLAKSHVFVLSSLWEGLPISILEAMRAGLPVVATDVGGVRESIAQGETGLLTEPRDVDGLRQALNRLLAEPGLRRDMGAEGRRLFEEYFGNRQMLERTAAIYAKLVGADLAITARPSD